MRICKSGIWNETVPGISFDRNGNSNYSKMFDAMLKLYPKGKIGLRKWKKNLRIIKKEGKGKEYDCIIGVSGGTDSSYLMHVAKRVYGLRPLAVTLDNGWSSEISVRNIQKMCAKLEIDLETYVVDYEEMKNLLLSYMKASLPWIDSPTDLAIKSILYKTAHKESVKTILIGHDFRSEGTQPREWTYSDHYQLNFINKYFGNTKLKSYPMLSMSRYLFLRNIVGIRMIYPFFYLNYNKQQAQQFLIKKYDWKYYGGHHHENLFTKFAIAYWMKEKFNIDKRIITYSAQVMSNSISREHALEKIIKPPYDKSSLKADLDLVCDKLGITFEDMNTLMNNSNRNYLDYPSYIKLVNLFSAPVIRWRGTFFDQVPTSILQNKFRNK